MGKVPPSFRPAISSSLTRKLPLEIPTPNHIPEKITKKKPPQHSRKPQASSASGKAKTLFKSPDLSSAKKVFNYIVATTKSSIDLRFHNPSCNPMPQSPPSMTPSPFFITWSKPNHFNMMVNNGLKPNQVTTDIAIRSLCEVGRIDHAVELVKELSLKQFPPDTYTFNFLVKNLCKCRTLSTVYGFIDDMKRSFDIKPDLVTYTILIDNVCNSKNLREAMRLVGVLNESGFKPDCFVYNTIMKGYCMLSKGSEAIESKEARKYLDILVESGHLPDAVTYTSLMNGMCREGNALGAVVLLKEMERKGCTPNSCTYNTLLHGLCKCRLMEKGMELYGAMKSAGMKLETASYATLVRALCREGRVAEAYDVFDYAVESKSLNDVAAYSTLEVTLKWLKKAREQGLAV
ncbi:Pentatricopeptide repeat-containing protein [Hibiscus syriacus]|uniref:Pentatricopeptide repeat-containing protein n=1 Tax=Hibiscus syriacus TaxID=106335 RepID=A0A6A3B456_HIBSY|nr:Pentatricopeptide repeat-containing protein [Hibiscus syriacus]